MEIEVAVLLDGQPIKANSDLQNLLQSLVNSYIKQSVSGKAEKKVKVPKVKDPNAPKREYRASFSPAEHEVMMDRATAMQHTDTMSKAVTKISNELHRSSNTIYLRLRTLVREGKLTFQTPVYGQKD